MEENRGDVVGRVVRRAAARGRDLVRVAPGSTPPLRQGPSDVAGAAPSGAIGPDRALRARRAATDPESEDAGFFDGYPAFTETSQTASGLRRLNWRYRMMIERQADLLDGARVLDIASHDGRWSFAALKAGAAHVTGLEFRDHLVRNATSTLTAYDVDQERYRFLTGDLFEVLAAPAEHGVEVDVVMCLGFLYHTIRYPELLAGIRRLNPRALILDTAVMDGEDRVVHLFAEDSEEEFNAARTAGEYGGMMMTGRPTRPALEWMLERYGFSVTDKVDWRHEGPAYPRRQGTLRYHNGRRVTWIARPV